MLTALTGPRTACALLVACALSACGGTPPPAEPPPSVEAYEQARRAGLRAFENMAYAQAATQFARARQFAFARDDHAAAVDAGYDEAVALAQLSRNQEAAMRVAEARAEARRGGLDVPPELLLLDATLSFRRGELGSADETAALLWRGTRPDLAARARFLSGVIAAERQDAAALAEALRALAPDLAAAAGPNADASGPSLALAADRRELEGRSALLDGRPGEAVAAFDDTARLRVASGELRALSRALELAGRAADANGSRSLAADYYLRAGRGALARRDESEARRLLGEVLARDADGAAAEEAARLLEALGG